MQEKTWVTLAFDRPGIHKPSKLAVPEEKPQARYPRPPKYYFLRMLIKLPIQG